MNEEKILKLLSQGKPVNYEGLLKQLDGLGLEVGKVLCGLKSKNPFAKSNAEVLWEINKL